MNDLPDPLPLLPAELLRRHSCAEPTDTRFRAVARLRQSLWREQHGYPCGRYVDANGRPRRLGSRVSYPELDALLLYHILVASSHLTLYLDRASDGIDHAGELQVAESVKRPLIPCLGHNGEALVTLAIEPSAYLRYPQIVVLCNRRFGIRPGCFLARLTGDHGDRTHAGTDPFQYDGVDIQH
jgi:hypothetical protein